MRSSAEARQRRVLQALVRLYIDGREPVSSRMIEESGDLDIRSASIRNVLGDLERQGLVAKPHASSGRVPTDLGYRAYVDDLLPGELDEQEGVALDRALREAGEDLGQILRATAQMLGRFTHNIAIMAGPRDRDSDATIGGVELYDRGGGRVLLALSLNTGSVRTELVELARDVTPGILLAASSFLAERLSGRTLDECRRELEAFLGEAHDEARSVAVDVAHRGRVVFSPEEVLQFTFEGIPEALEQPEFADPERLKSLLQLIARHELFEQALDDFVDGQVGEVKTAIGHENPLSALHPFTLMATRFDFAGQTGYLGVLGPRRMRYARSLALIHGIAGYLDRLS